MHVEKIKLKSGRVAYRLTWMENGRRKRRYFPPGVPYREVMAFKREMEARLAMAKAGLVDPAEAGYTTMNLHEFSEWYIRQRHAEVARKTRVVIRNAMDKLIQVLGPALRLADVTVEDLDYVQKKLLATGLDASTVRTYMATIKAAFRYASRHRLIRPMSFDLLRPPRAEERLPDILSPEQLDAIEAKIRSPRVLLAFKIIRYTGMRRGEVCSLDWRDVDLDSRMIRVRHTKTKRDREVPIHRDLLPLLQKFRKDSGPVIGIHPGSLTNALRRAKERAGLSHKHGSVHILRHSVGASLVTQGMDIRLIQELLGHKNISMTQHYTRVAKKTLLDKLDEAKL